MPRDSKKYPEHYPPELIHRKVISLRLHENLLERVDALVPIFRENEKLAPNGNSDRSAVIRTLIELGLQNYEGDGE